MKELEDVDVGWLAGILEGEGTFRASPDPRNIFSIRYQAQVVSVDKDVIDRLLYVTQIGTISGPLKKRMDHHSSAWRWSVQRKKDVVELLSLTLLHMSHRRKEKFLDILWMAENTGKGHMKVPFYRKTNNKKTHCGESIEEINDGRTLLEM